MEDDRLGKAPGEGGILFQWLGNLDFRLADAMDVLLVAVLIYWILRLIRGTRALYMLLGLALAVMVYWGSSRAELFTLNWILANFFGSLLLVVVVVFQHDIRRALTQMGRTPFFSSLIPSSHRELLEELVRTCTSLANKKIGALLVLERNADVSDYVDAGLRIDAVPSKELLTSLFFPSSPVHDGAVLIQKGRLTMAGCFLPLTMNPKIGLEVGTRHRAAVGLTEETDALVIVVSEEKGWISLAVAGQLKRGLDGPALRKLLLANYEPRPSGFRRFWMRRGFWMGARKKEA